MKINYGQLVDYLGWHDAGTMAPWPIPRLINTASGLMT